MGLGMTAVIDDTKSTAQGLMLAEELLSPAETTKKSHLAWLIWGVSAAFVLFQFFLQLSSGEMVGGLMKSFGLTALGGGVLASAYYYIYVALQTPAGMLMDRYGPRLLLSLGAVVISNNSIRHHGFAKPYPRQMFKQILCNS